MILKPVVPLSPVTVKETVIEAADWLVAIFTFDIWRLVTFPLIERLTFVPFSVVAVTFVANGVGEGDGVPDVVGVGLDCLGAFVDVGVDVDGGFVVGVRVGDGAEAFITVNELLVPELVLSVAVIVTSEPPVSTVIEVNPTPLTKALMMLGLIEPAEYVKDGAPT